MIFTKNSKKATLEEFLGSVLDLQDAEVIVVRGKKCEVLFANTKAEARANHRQNPSLVCKRSFVKSLPDLCDYCPYGERDGEADIVPFEIKDMEGRTYMVKSSVINWLDGKPASIFFLRDVTEEKENNKRLYTLAYVDQLTGVPNRQKLKEDFNALEEKIANNKLSGIVALFDLDHFKDVNDAYGHNTGDLILRRLTEHLQEDKTFSNHLYRLGGDEFVLLYSNPSDKFASDEEMEKYYYDLLSTALQSYTLPNIDVACTLSIGVSFFPRHGYNLSETLRKADIALYKAKDNGRNQVALFEDQYDTAQKFKNLFINIQPILLESGKTFGYDIIDCGNSDEGDKDTVNLGQFNRAFDALGLKDMEDEYYYFISYSSQLLNPAVLRAFPRDKFIIQIYPRTKLTASDLQTYLELRKKGYKLALGGLNSTDVTTEILKLADYCKFNTNDTNLSMQKKVIAANPNVRFIASNVDSQYDFQAAKDAGYKLYQGFFFSQPTVVKKTKEISPIKVNYFRLLKLSSAEGYMDFREISTIISSDMALSYKLLRILNSAAVGLRNVSSIAMAVAYLGEENLKKWISVLALRGIAEDQPLELVRMSLIRARFGELLAPHFRIKHNPEKIFMVGMLSLLHIALELSKAQMLEEIPMAEDIRDSLLTKNGVYSNLLHFYENYEYANWEDVSRFIEEHKLESQLVNDNYIAAVKWYNDLMDA